MSGECDKKCGHRHDRAMEKRRAARFMLPMAALGLIAWQSAALAAVPAAAQAGQVVPAAQTAEKGRAAAAPSAQQEERADAMKGEAASPQMQPREVSETTVAAEAKTEAAKEKRKDVEVQLEYLDGRFFKKRNVDLYNVHVYRQYKKLGALSLHYGLTFERATGYTTEDDIWRDAEAVGFGPSYMMRWTKHVSGKLDGSVDASGSLLAYNHAHPGNGRAYGFLWRIGPRLTYHYTDRDSLSLAYLFNHSSNGMGTHNPGYNGVGFSLGFTHWY